MGVICQHLTPRPTLPSGWPQFIPYEHCNVITQTILHLPKTSWHEQVRSEEVVSCHQIGLVAHCQLVVLDGVRGDVSPRVDVHETPVVEKD